MSLLDAQQFSDFETQGFVFFPALLSEAEAAVLRDGAARTMARRGPWRARGLKWCVRRTGRMCAWFMARIDSTRPSSALESIQI